MLVLLPVTAVVVLLTKTLQKEREPLKTGKTIVISCAVALVIGAYDGFYGPGTGTFLILLLTALAHLPLFQANGVSKVLNLTSNISSFIVFVISGNVLFPLGLVAGVFGIGGNFLGSSLFKKKGSKIALPVIIIVLSIFFVKVLLELLGVI